MAFYRVRAVPGRMSGNFVATDASERLLGSGAMSHAVDDARSEAALAILGDHLR